MIIHATRKLAARLPKISKEPLKEVSALGNWHADRLTLGGNIFRRLFADTLAALECPQAQIRRALMSLGPCGFDTATDRSVLSSMRVARQDLEAYLWNFPNVLMMDPVEASRRLTRRPVSVRGKHFWPQDRLLEVVAALE